MSSYPDHPKYSIFSSPSYLRSCAVEEEREQRFLELKLFLVEREYTPGLIDSAINRARAIPMTEALKESVNDHSNT